VNGVLDHPRGALLVLLGVILAAGGRGVSNTAMARELVGLGVLELASGDASAEENVELAWEKRERSV
jgi:hypothetical protein